MGALDPAQAALAKAQLAAMKPIAPPRRPETLHLALRYERLVREGRIEAASPYDPRIHASIDLGVEEEVALMARRYLNGFRGAGARQVAVMVAERGATLGGAARNIGGSNTIVAEVGSARFDGAGSGAFDFTRVTRSPGSTLKPFVYALAFERGALRATDILADIPEGASGVNNADGAFLGPMSPRQALANSRNVPAANLLRRVGIEANFHFLHELGLHDLEAPPESFGVSMAIGSLPTKLENLMRAYAALADDGVLGDLVYAREQRRPPPRRVMSIDTARLITSFLADPQARLPTFPRYGPLEYPFAVAVKTGTSQGYRDAWTLAYSKKFIVGVWLGRADAGTMKELGGAASSARLAHAILVKLHGAKPGDMDAESFPPPPDRRAVDLCLGRDARENCFETIREWVKPGEAAPVAAPALSPRGRARGRRARRAGPRHRRARTQHPHLAQSGPARRAEPAGAQTRARRARSSGAQIVWYVDGEPFVVAEADQTVFWPLQPGAHRISGAAGVAAGSLAQRAGDGGIVGRSVFILRANAKFFVSFRPAPRGNSETLGGALSPRRSRALVETPPVERLSSAKAAIRRFCWLDDLAISPARKQATPADRHR